MEYATQIASQNIIAKPTVWCTQYIDIIKWFEHGIWKDRAKLYRIRDQRISIIYLVLNVNFIRIIGQ